MEEDIKVLENLKGRWKDIGFGDKMCVCTCREQLAIENILNELERLQKEYERLKEKHKITYELNVGLLENTKECIPKQLIRDKIEELDKRNYSDFTREQNPNEAKIEILNELKELLGVIND